MSRGSERLFNSIKNTYINVRGVRSANSAEGERKGGGGVVVPTTMYVWLIRATSHFVHRNLEWHDNLQLHFPIAGSTRPDN